MAAISYEQAGVNRSAADKLVEKISFLSQATLNRRVKSYIGGYASLYELDKKRWIAASTDGVGTKLRLAFQTGIHNSIGIDLVAMSVNDLLCVGAKPLFFLDYFATGKLDPGVAEQVLRGIIEGCTQAQCALVGGETAEMPDFYQDGEYDLGGFAVGEVAPAHVLPKKEIKAGDVIIGIGSSGCHSNGYSLLRKLLQAEKNNRAHWMNELLKPTKIYVKSLAPLLDKNLIKGLAHITGSGFLNVPRISDRVNFEIELPAARELPPVFGWLKPASQLPLSELAQTFNLGIGMVVVVASSKSELVLKKLKRSGEAAWILGEVKKKRAAKHPSEIEIHDGTESATLIY